MQTRLFALLALVFLLTLPALARSQGLESASYRLESGAFRVSGLAEEAVGGVSGTRLVSPSTVGALAAGTSTGPASGISLEGGWLTSPIPVPEPSGGGVALTALFALSRRRSRREPRALRGWRRTARLAAFLAFLTAGAASAGPASIAYQGTLVDVGGAPLAGPVDLEFAFYATADPTDVTVLYAEEHEDVGLDAFGGFTLSLGTGSVVSGTFGPALFQAEARFLEITVEGEVLEPRQPVLSVPWALVATEIEGAPDLVTKVADATTQLSSFSAAFPGSDLGDAVSSLDAAVTDLQTGLAAVTGDSGESLLQQVAAAAARLDSIEAIVGDPLARSATPIAGTGNSVDFEMARVGANPIFALVDAVSAGFGDAYELYFVSCDEPTCSTPTNRFMTTGYVDVYEVCDTYEFDPETGEEFCTSSFFQEDYYGIGQQDVAMGSDGFPVVTYFDEYSNELRLVHCSESTCATQDPVVTLSDGTLTRSSASGLVMGASGYPIVALFDSVNDRLEVITCADSACSSTSTTTAVLATELSFHLDLTLGEDDRPVVALYDAIGRDLEFARCGDTSCSTIQASTLASTDDVGSRAKIAIGADGAPIIAYRNATSGAIEALKCEDAACTTMAPAQPLTLSPGTPSSSALSVGVNTAGKPVVAWTTDPDGSLVTVTCWEADCASSPNDVVRTLVADARKPRLAALSPVPSAFHVDTSGPGEVLRLAAIIGISARVLDNQTAVSSAQGAASAAQSTADGAQADATSALSGVSSLQTYLGEGQCGSLHPVQSSACPFSTAAPYLAMPNCLDAPYNSFCEGDGECATDSALNNCLSSYDVYYKLP